MAAAAAMTVLGELPASRAASAAISAGSPTRLISAATAMSSMARSFSRRDLMHERQREIRFQRLQRKIEHGMAVHARHLGLRVHDRRAGFVLHVLARNDGPDLAAQRLDLGVVGRGRLDGGQGELPAAARAPDRWRSRA